MISWRSGPTPPPIRPAPGHSVPLNSAAHLALGLNIGDVAPALRWLREADTRHVRLGCYWRNMLDPRRHAQLGNQTVERHFLGEVQAATRAGLDVLVVVHHAPDDDLYGRGFPAFIAGLAAKLPRAVTLQLHNEQNDPGRHWTPRLRGDRQEQWGAEYARLFARTHEALVERGHPHRLICGGIVGDPRRFLRGMRDTGLRLPDVIACHCYGRPATSQVSERAPQVREVLPNAEVWYTEVGSESGMTNGDAQAREVADVVTATRRAGAERLYWYRLERDRGFELIDQRGRARPAWRAWKDAQRAVRMAPR